MKYAVKIKDQKLKEKFEREIKKIFPHIISSSPEKIINENSTGIIAVDKENFENLINSSKHDRKWNSRNYLLILISEKDSRYYDYVDFTTGEIDENLLKFIDKKLREKMDKLSMKKFIDIPEELLKFYENLDCGLIIVDRELKIVFTNKKAVDIFKSRFSRSELLNMKFDQILELLTDSKSREFIRNAISDASEVNIDVSLNLDEKIMNTHLSIFPHLDSKGNFIGAFVSFGKLTNGGISKNLWEKTHKLVEKLENIIPEIGEKFFESIGEILKNFADINNLKSLIFIPLIFEKLEDYSDISFIIFVYKTKDGKYRHSVIMDPDIVNDLVLLFEKDKFSISNFYKILNKPNDIEDSGKITITLNHPLIYNDQIIGLLLMERETSLLREEEFFTKWFEKELSLLVVKALSESPSRLVDFIESLIGTPQKIAITVVNGEGIILRVNKEFYRFFNISPGSQLEGRYISDMPWLNSHPEIVGKISEHIKGMKPFFRKRWIAITPNDERFVEITGSPIKTDFLSSGKNYYVWTFEDLTDIKMAEIRREFIQNVLNRKMQIYEDISTILRVARYDKYEEFLLNAPKIVCEKLSLVSEGVLFFLKNLQINKNRGKPCTVCGQIKESIKDDDLCYLVHEVEKISTDKNINGEPFVVSLKDLRSFEELKKEGFDNVLIIPVISQGKNMAIGYILLFSKERSIFWRILQRLPKNVSLSGAQYEEIDIFTQFAEKVSTYLHIVKKEAEILEREQFAREIYDHVEDIVLIESLDGKIEFANRKAGNFYGYPVEKLIGKSVDLLIPEEARNLKEKIVQELIEKGEYSIIAPNIDSSGKLKWLNFNFRVVQFGGVRKVLVVGHDVTELREHIKTMNEMLVGIISALFNILENRSNTLKKHSINVAYLSSEIARRLKDAGEFNNERKIMCLTMASLLHDIGKISMPSNVLAQAKEKLLKYPHYYKLYKFHPKTGAEIVKSIPLPCKEAISKWIEQHHEKLDGSGFPMGKKLRPEEISLGARIIAVANEFENEVISRPMHKTKSPIKVLNYFLNSGKFDKTVVKALIELYNEGIVDNLVKKDEEADRKIKEIFNFLTGIYGERQDLEGHR